MSTYQKNYITLMRAAAGDVEARDDAVAILLRGVRTYFESHGEIDLARCCGLPSPTARGKFDLLERDYWLCIAFSHIDAPGPSARVNLLWNELGTFMERVWPNWKENGLHPDASSLRVCLYRAVAAMPHKIPESARQIYRIVVQDPIDTQAGLHMKGLGVVERDARSEWERSRWLQREFPRAEAYCSYRRAEAAGRIRHSDKIPDKNTPCNVINTNS